jgi:hypothetical protein
MQGGPLMGPPIFVFGRKRNYMLQQSSDFAYCLRAEIDRLRISPDTLATTASIASKGSILKARFDALLSGTELPTPDDIHPLAQAFVKLEPGPEKMNLDRRTFVLESAAGIDADDRLASPEAL